MEGSPKKPGSLLATHSIQSSRAPVLRRWRGRKEQSSQPWTQAVCKAGPEQPRSRESTQNGTVYKRANPTLRSHGEIRPNPASQRQAYDLHWAQLPHLAPTQPLLLTLGSVALSWASVSTNVRGAGQMTSLARKRRSRGSAQASGGCSRALRGGPDP